MTIYHKLPFNSKDTHILAAVDYVPKWVDAIPTKSADHAQ
jgi:hypothetical protein